MRYVVGILTGVSVCVATLAIIVAWMSQSHYQEVRNELDQHFALIEGVVRVQEHQNKLNDQMVATDRALADALTGYSRSRQLAVAGR